MKACKECGVQPRVDSKVHGEIEKDYVRLKCPSCGKSSECVKADFGGNGRGPRAMQLISADWDKIN